MMMERLPANYISYQKKIMSYLDGSLSHEEKAEFEAFVMTHPDFEAHIRTKEDEIFLIKSLIPTQTIAKSSLESLETEMRTSVFNLLREEPKSFLERLKLSWEDLINR